MKIKFKKPPMIYYLLPPYLNAVIHADMRFVYSHLSQ